MVDLDELRRESLDSWDRFSSNWEEEREFLAEKTGPVRERMVERLDPQAGETILELAAGTGETGFAVADRLGAEGRLIMTDFAPGMVEACRRRGEELGASNVDYRILDAEQIDLDDDSVDGVDCRFGYMLMADPAKALTETRRVLRDDGRLVFAVWGPPLENLWAAIPGMTMVELGHMPAPEPGVPGIFAMADPERIVELVTGAGFAEPQIEQIEVDWGYTSPEEHWSKTLKLAAPIADAWSALDADGQEEVRRKVAERVAEQLSGGGVNGVVHIAVTT